MQRMLNKEDLKMRSLVKSIDSNSNFVTREYCFLNPISVKIQYILILRHKLQTLLQKPQSAPCNFNPTDLDLLLYWLGLKKNQTIFWLSLLGTIVKITIDIRIL